MGELLITGFVMQHFLAEVRQPRIQPLNVAEQRRSEAAHLFGVELVERMSRNHGNESA